MCLELLCTEHAAKGANKREASRMERDGDAVRWRDSRRHGRGEVTVRRTTCQEERKVSARKRKKKRKKKATKRRRKKTRDELSRDRAKDGNGDGIRGKGTEVTKGRRREDEGRAVNARR